MISGMKKVNFTPCMPTSDTSTQGSFVCIEWVSENSICCWLCWLKEICKYTATLCVKSLAAYDTVKFPNMRSWPCQAIALKNHFSWFCRFGLGLNFPWGFLAVSGDGFYHVNGDCSPLALVYCHDWYLLAS